MQVIVCDVCKDHKVPARSICLPYDRESDPAGQMTNAEYYIDLCLKCELKVYHQLIEWISKCDNSQPVALDLFSLNTVMIRIIKNLLGK